MKQVYIHGLGQTPASWEPVLHLLDTSSDAICPDLTKMVSAEDATYSTLYHSFTRFCDGLETPLALCGLSLGAVLSLHYAAEHPEQIHSLALIAPQYKIPKRLLQVQNALFHFMPQFLFQETSFAKSQFIQLCSSMMHLDLSTKLSRISCPTLILYGSRDRANQQACTELAQLLRQAELCIVAGAGHELNREAPEKLAPLLQKFCDRTRLSP